MTISASLRLHLLWLTSTWIYAIEVWMNWPPAGWIFPPIRGELMLNAFCPVRLLPGTISWSSASQQGLSKSLCPRRLNGFSTNKRVAELKCDASVVSPLIYKAIKGRQIITLPLLGSKTRSSWLLMDFVQGKWNSWQNGSTWCCFDVGLSVMSLALRCFQATPRKLCDRELQ